jgi:hypothetical protein
MHGLEVRDNLGYSRKKKEKKPNLTCPTYQAGSHPPNLTCLSPPKWGLHPPDPCSRPLKLCYFIQFCSNQYVHIHCQNRDWTHGLEETAIFSFYNKQRKKDRQVGQMTHFMYR